MYLVCGGSNNIALSFWSPWIGLDQDEDDLSCLGCRRIVRQESFVGVCGASSRIALLAGGACSSLGSLVAGGASSRRRHRRELAVSLAATMVL